MNDDTQNEIGEAEEIMDEDGLLSGDLAEKTMAERAQEIGRDGAYLEVEARDIVKLYRSGDLQRAKMIVVLASRTDISDPEDVQDFVSTVAHIADKKNLIPDIDGMTDEQLSGYIMRKMMHKGLKNNDATKKARSTITLCGRD